MGIPESRLVDEGWLPTIRPYIYPLSGTYCSDDSSCSENPIDWFTKNDCATLVEDMQSIVNNAPQCRYLSDSDKNLFIQNILARSVAADSYTCILAIDNKEKVAQLIDDRCREKNGSSFAQATPPQGTQPPPPPDEEPSWLQKLGIPGIITGATAGALYLLNKLGILTKILEALAGVVNQLAVVITKLNAATKNLMKAFEGGIENIKYFFGHVLVKIGRLAKSIFTGQIFRKKAPQQNRGAEQTQNATGTGQTQETQGRRRLRETNPEIRIFQPTNDPLRGNPELSVVISQFGALRQEADEALVNPSLDRRERITLENLAAQSEIFMRENELVQLFIALLAVDRWDERLQKQRESAEQMLHADSRPFFGYLPHSHIKYVAAKYLTPDMVSKLRSSALARIKKELKESPDSEFALEVKKIIAESKIFGHHAAISLEGVRRQFLTDQHFTEEMGMYAAAMTTEEWNSYGVEQQLNIFMQSPLRINADELPQLQIRAMKQRINMANVRKLAPIYAQLLRLNPQLQRLDFSIVNARAERLNAVWENPPPNINLRRIFGRRDDSRHLPASFVRIAKSSFEVGTSERYDMAQAETSWEYAENDETVYKDIRLAEMMDAIAKKNPSLRSYPGILEQRAKSLIDDWEDFDSEKKDALGLEQFAKLWVEINAGLGVDTRSAIRNNGQGSGGNGENGNNGSPAAQGGGSTVTGTFDPNEVSSGSQGARRTVEIPLARSAYIARARQRAIVSGGFLCRRPASSAANTLRSLFTLQRPAFATVR